MSRTRLTLLALVVALAFTSVAPAQAADGPYPQVAAENGACPGNYVYSDDADICVSRIGEYDGQLWRCGKSHHPQFQVFPDFERPQRCCRKNWPPPLDGSGKGKGLCHRWHPKPYDDTGVQE